MVRPYEETQNKNILFLLCYWCASVRLAVWLERLSFLLEVLCWCAVLAVWL